MVCSSRSALEIADATAAQLERLLSHQLQAHPDMSGARLIDDGLDAFALRVLSLRAAERSVDLQYYMWRGDPTGRFLTHEVLAAADRGVAVRLLLDDMDARSHDAMLIALGRHSNIQVRLFNPFATRSGLLRTALELFARGSRLNRRMHNKVWVVDQRIAVVGGRNIGDEYFAASDEVNFVDADVLLVGPVVAEVMRSFEEYWNSPAAISTGHLLRLGVRGHRLKKVRRMLSRASLDMLRDVYGERLRDAARIDSILTGRMVWAASVRFVADPPHKVVDELYDGPDGVLRSLIAAIDGAQREVLLISPYFVPGAGGTAALRQLIQRGVKVAVLTNSLAATDVAAVHGGYARYRESLVEGGVELFELKAAAAPSENRRRLRVGSSRASLHTKAAVIDDERVFVGSFNLDPRSADLNCEMGVWIDSSTLAVEMKVMFGAMTSADNSYRVALDGRRLIWSEKADCGLVEHTREPHASWPRRLLAWLLQRLPLESHL